MRLIRPSHDAICAQFRESISRRLDSELSQLDEARLDAHLAGCADCRGYAAEVRAVTAMLRAAPVEEPAFAVRLPRNRRIPVRMLQAGAAAVAVAALVTMSTFGSIRQREQAGPQGFSANLALGHDDE